jgi:hypothetical protein
MEGRSNICDRPSYIRVNQRPSAVKKERSPFLTQIQKSDRYLE